MFRQCDHVVVSGFWFGVVWLILLGDNVPKLARSAKWVSVGEVKGFIMKPNTIVKASVQLKTKHSIVSRRKFH